jgi:hypothetical protein
VLLSVNAIYLLHPLLPRLFMLVAVLRHSQEQNVHQQLINHCFYWAGMKLQRIPLLDISRRTCLIEMCLDAKLARLCFGPLGKPRRGTMASLVHEIDDTGQVV